MRTAMKTGQRAQWIAVTLAALGTLLTLGGTLSLAEHYAQTGGNRDASGYYSAKQVTRIGCSDNGGLRSAVVSRRRGAENS